MAHIGVKCTGTDVPVYMVKIRLDKRLSDCDGLCYFTLVSLKGANCTFNRTFALALVNVCQLK